MLILEFSARIIEPGHIIALSFTVTSPIKVASGDT
jgi:hypothetical protein